MAKEVENVLALVFLAKDIQTITSAINAGFFFEARRVVLPV
jgi:hypothetical protein